LSSPQKPRLRKADHASRGVDVDPARSGERTEAF
jgi:hypothetical protein